MMAMSDITLRAAVSTQVFLADLQRHMRDLRERLSDEDGQVSVEWVGILALVGTIVAIILNFHLDTKVGNKVSDAFNNIFGGGGDGGGGGGGGQ
jgi:Flp pilus assembly pilin Flp